MADVQDIKGEEGGQAAGAAGTAAAVASVAAGAAAAGAAATTAAAAAAAAAPAAAPPIPNAAPHESAPNKRIIGMAVPPTAKRATRASTGAPIVLTAKGSLYKARKDTGDSLVLFSLLLTELARCERSDRACLPFFFLKCDERSSCWQPFIPHTCMYLIGKMVRQQSALSTSLRNETDRFTRRAQSPQPPSRRIAVAASPCPESRAATRLFGVWALDIFRFFVDEIGSPVRGYFSLTFILYYNVYTY